MKLTLFQICIKAMFSELLQDPSYCLNMELSKILSIDQDFVQIHYNEDIKPFSENLVDVALKTGGCVGQAKGHYLVLKVAESGAKGRPPLITLSNSHLMIGTSQV